MKTKSKTIRPETEMREFGQAVRNKLIGLLKRDDREAFIYKTSCILADSGYENSFYITQEDWNQIRKEYMNPVRIQRNEAIPRPYYHSITFKQDMVTIIILDW